MSDGAPSGPPPLPASAPAPAPAIPAQAADPWPRFVPVLWLMAALLLVNVVLTIHVRVTGDESPLGDTIATAVAAAIVTGFALRERHFIARSLRIGALGARDWGWTAAVFAAIAVVIEVWFWMATRLFDTIEMLEPFRTHGWPPWSAVVLVVVCPAIFEELAFRGFLQQRLGGLIGRGDALALQAALFAILHMSPVSLPSHFAFGLGLGWLRNRTGSLVPGMVVHAAWNFTVLVQEGLLAGW